MALKDLYGSPSAGRKTDSTSSNAGAGVNNGPSKNVGPGGTSFAKSPVSPLQKNIDSPDNLKRAIDKRAKKVPVNRVVATRAPKERGFASRSSSRPGR